MFHLRSRLLVALLLLLPAALAGCESTVEPPSDDTAAAVGKYVLVEANGFSVPVVLRDDYYGYLEVTGGWIQLRPDQSFTEEIGLSVRSEATGLPQTATYRAEGTFTFTGTTIRLRTGEGVTATGLLSGDT